MWKICLTVFLFITFAIFSPLSPASYPKDIYKWVDKDGNLHFTDNPSLIPKDKTEEAEMIKGRKTEPGEIGVFDVIETSPAPSNEEETEEESEEDRKEKEKELRELWGSRALEIDSREESILAEIQNTEREIIYKKREVDYLLINGYAADFYILELRNLEDYLKDLDYQLSLIGQERGNLRDEARRQGIPPGYLRP